jgi:hypothetical protein
VASTRVLLFVGEALSFFRDRAEASGSLAASALDLGLARLKEPHRNMLKTPSTCLLHETTNKEKGI